MTDHPAGPALDALVAERVTRLRGIHGGMYWPEATYRYGGSDRPIPSYSTAIAAAWELPPVLAARGLHLTLWQLTDSWQAVFQPPHLSHYREASHAPTAPHALSLAALAAVEREP